ncbi:MAG: transcription antitermination factor NusB [Mariprofundaceae bacterium]|nr:transcription antitermination factor NusB [Mariprofundaceae bacterium]
MNTPSYSVRNCALQVLHAVLCRKRKAKAEIEAMITRQTWQSRDVGLLRELVYGVLKHYYALEVDVSRFVPKKPEEHARLALLLGAYQLRHMRVPDHAAVAETVAAIKPFDPRAAGFVNAVLRQVSQQPAPEKLKPQQRAELPKWMYALWRDAFSAEKVQSLSVICQATPDICLAVLENRETWLEKAESAGFSCEKGQLSPFSVLLSAKTDVSSLPDYAEGAFMVMDQAAQAAVMAMQIPNSTGVLLDLCASPGGKTALLAHRFPQHQVVAVELNAKRLPRLTANIQRLKLNNTSILRANCADLPFADCSVDAILLDAPCTASGTLRRHPDVKFVHDQQAMLDAAALQLQLLHEAWRVLQYGGVLVYAVCSIHPAENEAVLADIRGVELQQRLFPSAEHDGFFFARIRKVK